MTVATEQPLAGLVVLDLTLARAGPTCVRHLADWGADVIAVQAPGAGEELIAARRLRLPEPAPQQALHQPRPEVRRAATRRS